MKAAGIIGLDPLAVKRMTIGEFQAYAAGFVVRNGGEGQQGPSENDLMLALASEAKKQPH